MSNDQEMVTIGESVVVAPSGRDQSHIQIQKHRFADLSSEAI